MEALNAVIERLRREPVLVTAFVQAVMILVVSFGVHLSNAQSAAILGVTTAIMAIVARSRVTPVETSEPRHQADQ